MLRTYMRSVSGPLSRHVCLSCLARPGARFPPSLRQFHRISALRTNAGETEPTTNSFDASTESSVPPPNGQIPETKDAASSEPQKPQPSKPKLARLTASMWAGMTISQKKRYRHRYNSDFHKFKKSMLANRDITLAEAVKLEIERVEAGGAPSEAPSKSAPSEAARVEAEKIKALQQKVVPTDVEDRQEKAAEHKEGEQLTNAKIEAQMGGKEKESRPEAEIPTDGPNTPAASGPKKRTLNLQSTSNVAAQILEASKSSMDNGYKKKPKEAEQERLEGEEISRFVADSSISKDCGSLSSVDRRLHLKAVPAPMPPVPRVAFGLDRVLFNPGVYQLRDPRTLVYNFDPYLDQIMPVTEFDFGTLKPYITSSQDVTACQMTQKNGKKYYGSSSSMTSVLAHFHYLLSDWRPVDTSRITRGFDDPTRSFTRILRAPAAMFLHYKADEDVYAIDADKEYDYANILMNLGKSMEKQLTLPKEQFERYRRSDPNKITAEEEATVPESYHYSTAGKFLMRSQLDAYDPRLPGTGMFDLKTRAAVSIRMEATDHKRGMGYEIRRQFGKWESFEREYFDMIRAAFLKYSLQVRIGRMDGIFVAYHNIERIFGFQYIPLSEMDQALHSSPNTTLGNREFELSIGLWEKIMDKATQRFPKRSLRFHFETREGRNGDTWMDIVAQPVTSEEIENIQNTNKAHIDAIQDRLMNPDQYLETNYERAAVGEGESLHPAKENSETENLDPEDKFAEYESRHAEESTDSSYPAEKPTEPEPIQQKEDPSVPSLADQLFPKEEGDEEFEEEAYDTSFELPDLEPIAPARTKTVPKRGPNDTGALDENVLAMTLVVHSKVNGEPVARPTWMTDTDEWSVDYELTELGVRESNHVLRACKRRRNNALRKNVQDHNEVFFSTLKKVTNRGRQYRKRLDEKDRERGILVYQDSCEM
ncbi:unnamed protein product [Penicillium nalgiovense]|uniref:Mitochondrial mRNA processing protein PET127 n=1 Tax=Penicillium nalgiovense TaxID=60175 RepID=A0A9W4I2I4_PENNA|nr:unnamed protein product [Penicillium nalgiovense]CAG7997169.1 unnamed protein product [Penicillium nalgiovense]CAG8083752.1 unnamed protein product [Penicillium nalgiovense]CAG8101624.1 unnamed protein product [Penicillium nalgiovense]CAG8108917.1 unnamed protein product [Penicillium nalgiovense]